MATLDIAICTLNEGIERVAAQLLPTTEGISYIVSMQYDENFDLSRIPKILKERADVKLLMLKGRGLCRNRNHALRAATADYVYIADDDLRFNPQILSCITEAFEHDADMDIALFRLTDYEGRLFKSYPASVIGYRTACRTCGYYPSSLEIVLKRTRVVGKITFDERFGLCAGYFSAGEEEVLLADAERMGLRIRCIPVAIGMTSARTTGSRFLYDASVQRSKGAVFLYRYGLCKALWLTLKEFIHYLLRGHTNAWGIPLHMIQGMRFVASTNSSPSFPH